MNIEALDDPPVIDACPGFAGGQVSSGPSDEIAVNQFVRGNNVDIAGKTATTRRGTVQLSNPMQEGYAVQGLAWLARPSQSMLVAVCNGIIFASSGDGAFYGSGYVGADWTEMDFLIAGIAGPVAMAQMGDKLYLAHPSTNLFYFDGTHAADLGSGGPTSPPRGSILINHTQRLFMAGIANLPDTVAVSDFLDGGTWDMATKSFQVGGDGDPIIGLCSWVGHRVIVFKRSSIWAVDADPLVAVSDWPVVRITNQLGAVSSRGIAQVGNDVFFLSDSGIHSIRRTVASADADEVAPPISEPIQDLIDRINWDAADRCAAVWWKNRFFLSVPLDGAQSPSHCLVYDSLRNAWAGVWNWPALCFAISKSGAGMRFNMGREDGTVRQWLEYVPAANEVETTFQDAGVPIETSILTRGMIFGQAALTKDALNARVEFFDSNALASVAVRLDESEPITIAEDIQTGEAGLEMPFDLPAILPGTGIKARAFCLLHLPAFNRMQIEVSSSSGKLSLRAAIAAAFVNALDIEK